MSGRVTRKWRPRLGLVIGGTLLAVFSLPVLGITWLRLGGNILGWAETAWLIVWIAFVASLALAWLFWRLVLRPVWALTAYARAMQTGQNDLTTPKRFGTAELSDLGQSVIDMGDALQGRARSLSAYADHVTHELKSPLTGLRGAADLLKDDALAPDDREALLNTIDLSAARMETLLNDLRTHAAARMTFEPGASTLAEALQLADLPSNLSVQVTADAISPISAGDLARIVTQMARNAFENGATLLKLEATDQCITIRDDGDGIPEGDRARIFDPFFTTRRETGGTGMGLAIVRTLTEAAGGAITLESCAQGTEFRLNFSRY